MIGRRLSHYEVLEELGRGGMGVVYKARDTKLGRFVALKLLPSRLAGDPDRIDRLKREAMAVARLSHPRIVTVYSVEETDGHVFVTMEYVDGRTLDRAIPRHGFPLDRFLKIAIPLADALGSAHSRQIVHRDLKPGNIMLSREDRPKILDFGLAKLRAEESSGSEPAAGEAADSSAATQIPSLEGKLAGTIPYMSPEQLNRGPVDHRTDIFSLGVVYYEMATGRHPYGAESTSVVSSILQQDPVSVADVRRTLPRQLGRILRHCLEKNPAERVQSAIDLRNDLLDLQRELARSATRRSAGRAGRLRRYALPVLLSAAVLAGAGWLVSKRLAPSPALEAQSYLVLRETRIFPGDRGPGYLRRGLLQTLRQQLSGLDGVQLLSTPGPSPDLVVLADARQSAETAALSYRLRSADRQGDLADDLLEGPATDLVTLIERSGRSIALALDRQPDLKVSYRASEPPTRDAAALDLYLQALVAENPAGETLTPAQVRQLLGQALDRDPGLARAHLVAGRSYLEEHRAEPAPVLVEAAESRCREAIESGPRLAAAWACLGESLMLKERTTEAVAAFRRALELDTSDLTVHSMLHQAFRSFGVQEDAERTWRELIARRPDQWAAYFSLGRHYQDSERYEEALEQYRRALELAPREPDVRRYLGTSYIYLGRHEEAEVALKASIATRPSWDAHYNLGGLYFNLRRFPAAVVQYRRAVELDRSDYRSHGRLGWACFWASGQRQEAPLHLRRAIELADQDDPDARILTTVYHAMLGDRQRSLEALSGALELRPNEPHYFYLAGVAMNHLGDTAGALDWLRRAIDGGFSTAEIRNVIDLENLSSDPRFQQLLREADGKAT